MTWDDVPEESALRTLMRDEEIPPTRVDVMHVVRAGRRAERRWRLATGTLAVTAVVGAVAIPATIAVRDRGPDGRGVTATSPDNPTPDMPKARCDVEEFAGPAQHGDVLNITAVDPTGRYVVATGFDNGTATVRPVLWVDGVPSVFDVPGAGQYAEPVAVNASGVVAGSSRSSEEGPFIGFAWVYRDGQLDRLPAPAGFESATATSINARGDIAGIASKADGSSAVVWPADARDRPRVLDGPTPHTEATAIADDGTVYGNANDDPLFAVNSGHAYRWGPDGTAVELSTPEGLLGARVAGVRGNLAFGWAYSAHGTNAMPWIPARWDVRTGKVTTYPQREGTVSAASDTGWLLLMTAGRPVIRIAPDGTATRLPVKLENLLSEGNWISDDGRTSIGLAPASDSEHTPVTWRCSD
jgi:hypothetical protein